MRAAIHNPYLDTLGGGERYTLSFAKVLLSKGWKVDLEWNDPKIKTSLENRFGMDLSELGIVDDVKRGGGYDLCFWVSDGSIPTLQSRKNILHFQFPFHNVSGKSLLNRMKLFRISKIICNSNFTKEIVDKEYGINSVVVYPPVPVSEMKPKRKENIILYVGRFSQLTQSKHQDVLIKAFKKLYDGGDYSDSGLNQWKLVLAGGIEIGVESGYLDNLRKTTEGYPIKIIKSPDYKTLKELYGVSRIFWSASGYGEDENKNPKMVEHFGMTAVEAMAAGAVPALFNAGGHKEIINDGVNGFIWDTTSSLILKTKKIVSEKGIYTNLSKEAKKDSLKFSYERFEKEIKV